MSNEGNAFHRSAIVARDTLKVGSALIASHVISTSASVGFNDCLRPSPMSVSGRKRSWETGCLRPVSDIAHCAPTLPTSTGRPNFFAGINASRPFGAALIQHKAGWGSILQDPQLVPSRREEKSYSCPPIVIGRGPGMRRYRGCADD